MRLGANLSVVALIPHDVRQHSSLPVYRKTGVKGIGHDIVTWIHKRELGAPHVVIVIVVVVEMQASV